MQEIFSLPAAVTPVDEFIDKRMIDEILEKIAFARQSEILKENAERNAKFFETEIDKLDKWADDVKNSLEIELKDLDKEIKFRKIESKKNNLP